jgi:uncharacterized protein (DUF1697 family)
MNYVALLRGINVGGKNTLSMAELKITLEKAGLENVRTYINSGNVLFSSDKSDESALAKEIEKVIQETFDMEIRTLVVSEPHLRKAIDDAPKGFGTEPDKYHTDIIFLIDITSDEAFKIFNPREGVDKVWQGDKVIYSQRLSAERTKSRLAVIVASSLYKYMTIRTYRTALKLLSLLEAK